MCFRQWFHPHHQSRWHGSGCPDYGTKEVGNVPGKRASTSRCRQNRLAAPRGGHDERQERRAQQKLRTGWCSGMWGSMTPMLSDPAHNGGRQDATRRGEHHDGPDGKLRTAASTSEGLSDASGRFKIRHRDRQRFVRAALAFAQQATASALVARRRQIKTSRPLTATMFPARGGGCRSMACCLQRNSGRRYEGREHLQGQSQPDFWPADRGRRLSWAWKRQSRGIVVFGSTVRAQGSSSWTWWPSRRGWR